MSLTDTAELKKKKKVPKPVSLKFPSCTLRQSVVTQSEAWLGLLLSALKRKENLQIPRGQGQIRWTQTF